MRDRGIKCYKTHPKDPMVHKRPTIFSVPSLIQEHWGIQQWGEALKPLYQARLGQSLSPWANLPSPGFPATYSCSYLHLTAWGNAKIGPWGARDDVQTGTSQYNLQNGKWDLASEGVFAYNLEGKRRKHWNIFFEQAGIAYNSPRLTTPSGKTSTVFPLRVVILIK